MDKRKRIYLHIAFWLSFWLLNGYVQFFLYQYRGSSPLWLKLLGSFGTELVVLPLRMAVAYVTMYFILPRYFDRMHYGKLLLSSILLIGTAVALYRLSIHWIIYPYIYQSTLRASDWWMVFPRMAWTVLDFASVAGIAATIKLVRMRLKTLEREKSLVEEKLQSELNFLRAQTNPHFLFNTLNNIYALARKKSDQTAPVVMKLSKLLRFMLYECTSPQISIGQEAKVIADYIELEQLRFNNRLKVSFDQAIDDPEQPIAPLLLLPLVENAFKHGVSESRFNAWVDISLMLKDGTLDFRVNNWKDVDQTFNGNGIGLQNVQRQLELLYPDRHQLSLDVQKDQFTAHLTIESLRVSKGRLN